MQIRSRIEDRCGLVYRPVRRPAGAQQGLGHPCGRGLAVGAGDVDHRARPLRDHRAARPARRSGRASARSRARGRRARCSRSTRRSSSSSVVPGQRGQAAGEAVDVGLGGVPAGPGSSPPPRRGPWPGTSRWRACAVPAQPRRARRRDPSPPGAARRQRRSRRRCPVPPSRPRPRPRSVGRNSGAGRAEPQQGPDAHLVAGQGAGGQAGERGGNLLPGAQALVGAEPADLGDQPHQRGDLGLRGRVVAVSQAAAARRAAGPATARSRPCRRRSAPSTTPR